MLNFLKFFFNQRLNPKSSLYDTVHDDYNLDPMNSNPENGRRISIVTTNYFIDCRVWDWKDFVNKPARLDRLKKFLLQGVELAAANHKKYMLHSKELLPESLNEFRIWMQKNNIEFKEG